MTVVLCTRSGALLGALPPIDLAVPWFPGVVDLVDGVRERYGIDITVLRLLDADRPPAPSGGAHVVHLAQVDAAEAEQLEPHLGPVPPLPAHALAEHPLRASYARPGGPEADLAWADGELARHGTVRTGRPRQIRTWNLSSIWQLPTSAGSMWLKAVPQFFAHEGPVLDLLHRRLPGHRGSLPSLVAHDGGRVLLADVPGEDQYRAGVPLLLDMVPLLVSLQVATVSLVDDLLAAGAFHWRSPRFDTLAADVVDRSMAALDRDTRRTLARLVEALPQRWSAIAECGIPDALVHGDFHPGNLRGTAEQLVLLDWGDSGVGHPLLDQAAFLAWVPEDGRDLASATWARLWREAVPGSDPERASRLLGPVAALRQAVIYRLFLDGIEPSERIYHEADPQTWLARAAALADR